MKLTIAASLAIIFLMLFGIAAIEHWVYHQPLSVFDATMILFVLIMALHFKKPLD